MIVNTVPNVWQVSWTCRHLLTADCIALDV